MLDFNAVFLPAWKSVFHRPVTITPYGSQPGAPAYNATGTYVTGPVDVVTEGNVVFGEQRTALDIRMADFPIIPVVRDHVYIGPHMSMPAAGLFEVQDVDKYYDGRARLALRAVVDDNPRPYQPPRP